MAPRGRVLIVAGSDSGGGAGIQADIKTVTALGGFAMTAITALTAQNTEGVFGIHEVPAEFVARQMRVVIDDIGVDCIKIGMLHSNEVIDAVCDTLRTCVPEVPLVVDPVMIAKGGAALLSPDAMDGLRASIVPLASVLTPNLPEARALVGSGEDDGGDVAGLAAKLLALGPRAVLVKGGHASGATVTDVLVDMSGTVDRFVSPRIDTRNTHGTGCTLASAIAVGLAQGLETREAIVRARAYVHEAIRTAPGFGRGHGPLNHVHALRPAR